MEKVMENSGKGKIQNYINPLQPGVAYVYPLKTSENV